MQLTKGVEQAICIIVLLSTQDNHNPLASDTISEHLQVSPSYLKKIMRKLVVQNIIRSVPGNNGGFSLAKSPEQITLLEVVESMEGEISIYPDTGLINKVFRDGVHTSKGEAVLHDVFNGANSLLRDYLVKQTAADLLKRTMEQSEIPVLNWNITNTSNQNKKE
ncbi:RrF2 family transcriptional regulator [Listeria booriae]|uniref:RrF2 family transcriptional regulator n=1 Tax=Listeria booriae TaxID=1552123 RepID=UPI00162A05ED|nr:Rrf2 family transcriptional regulator [Listeria booriae]MBC2327439.1 Rrf2 family transcriptional regulator [Listeria booriae]